VRTQLLQRRKLATARRAGYDHYTVPKKFAVGFVDAPNADHLALRGMPNLRALLFNAPIPAEHMRRYIEARGLGVFDEIVVVSKDRSLFREIQLQAAPSVPPRPRSIFVDPFLVVLIELPDFFGRALRLGMNGLGRSVFADDGSTLTREAPRRQDRLAAGYHREGWRCRIVKTSLTRSLVIPSVRRKWTAFQLDEKLRVVASAQRCGLMDAGSTRDCLFTRQRACAHCGHRFFETARFANYGLRKVARPTSFAPSAPGDARAKCRLRLSGFVKETPRLGCAASVLRGSDQGARACDHWPPGPPPSPRIERATDEFAKLGLPVGGGRTDRAGLADHGL